MRFWLQVRRLKIQRIRSLKLPDIKDSPPDEPGCSGKKRKWSNKEENNSPSQAARKKAKVDVECHLFVCETTQLTDFVDKINETSCCSTPDCNGMYRSADYFLCFFQCRYLFAAL